MSFDRHWEEIERLMAADHAERAMNLKPARRHHGVTARRVAGVLLLATVLVAVLWLFTHEGCAHPVGNTVAAIHVFLVAPFTVLHWIETA